MRMVLIISIINLNPLNNMEGKELLQKVLHTHNPLRIIILIVKGHYKLSGLRLMYLKPIIIREVLRELMGTFTVQQIIQIISLIIDQLPQELLVQAQ